MDLLGITLRAVDRAFTITQQFQTQATFQLQIVWNLDPVHDTVTEVPSYTKTVMAVWYKPLLKRTDPAGNYLYTENLCVQQWDDAPAPSINDRVIIPSQWGNLLRQVMSVFADPALAIWIVETRVPTKQ
jgi:hypothetical protein